MLNLRFILLVTCLTNHFCCGYKILLVFPIPGTSHSILGEAFVKVLLKAGHEVTYITPIPIKNPPPKLHQVNVSTNFNVMPTEELFNIRKLMNKEVDLTDVSKLIGLMDFIANNTLMHENVQRLLHDPNAQFDTVIVEWMYNELYSGFSSVFDCPLIWSSSMDSHYLVLSLIDEDPNPAYTSDIFTSDTPPYTFIQRVFRLWSYIETKIKKRMSSATENEIFEKAFSSIIAKKGYKLSPLDVVKYNGALMFGNSHVSTGQSFRLPLNYIPIGGYHIDPDIKPLPQDLQHIMDSAKHGVIYFSMGSLLKSKHIPDELKTGVLRVFAELKQIIIWKFEERIQNLPDNVHIVNWAPQHSILAHPNCVLFITHGGLLSQTETLHFGIPAIGIPMFADQFVNINRAVDKGFAKRVDLDFQTPANLKAAIEDILGNPRYHERAKELSFVYHHRPASPRVELVHWVEHVVRTRGAPHLRSPALHLAWYQKTYLDFAGLIIIIVVAVLFTLKTLCFNKYHNNLNWHKKKN